MKKYPKISLKSKKSRNIQNKIYNSGSLCFETDMNLTLIFLKYLIINVEELQNPNNVDECLNFTVLNGSI